MHTLTIVKIGGNVIDVEADKQAFLDLFVRLPGPKLLVHGGGKLATDLAKRLGYAPQLVDGRRITDANMLDLVTMVYGGLISRQLVAQLQARGCPALGITGADANVLPATRRPVGEIDYGWVGDVLPEHVNVTQLTAWLAAGLTPVLAPLTHDGAGHLLNTNADTIAATLARAFAPTLEVKLFFCFDQPGVMRNLDDSTSLVPSLNPAQLLELKREGRITAGMLPKLLQAEAAAAAGVADVLLCKWNKLLASAAGEAWAGTRILP